MDHHDNHREHLLQEHQTALERLLGNAEPYVFKAREPLAQGGDADVLVFKGYVEGFAYVTAGLTGDPEIGQIQGEIGPYELMICTREEAKWAADLVSRLAIYTHETVINPGETMDFPFFPDSPITALLFTLPETRPGRFELFGEKCALLLCVGITAEELEIKQKYGSTVVVELLKEKGLFPYTVLK